MDEAIRRLASRSVAVDGCVVWSGYVSDDGYGYITFKGSTITTHKLAFESVVGPVPDGLEIDHLCRNRACWNPDHLEAVTHQENMRRAAQHWNRRRETCPRGHELVEENLYEYRGARACRACRRDARRRHYRRSVAA